MNRLLTLLAALAGAAALDDAGADERSSFCVMTFNIRYNNPGDGPNAWPFRRDEVAKFIQDREIDVAGLQEVTSGQLDDLKDRLPEFEFLGTGRDDGKRKGEFSPLLVRRERFEVAENGTFWLSETPGKVGSKGWDAALPRICTWAKLKPKVEGLRAVCVASTHFDHKGVAARAESAKLIVAKLDHLFGKSPAVLMGDFNCRTTDKPYQTLVESREGTNNTWYDAHGSSKSPHKGPDSTWNGFKAVVPGQRIDFIFVRGVDVLRHEVPEAKIGERFLSDHLPVVADVQ
jgi:endonuclease/exonuclease/phosphatase family metal-dependent hydrolase